MFSFIPIMKKRILLIVSLLWIAIGVYGQCSASFDYETDGTSVYFEASTDPGPGDVMGYFWDFGDGTYAYSASEEHEFDETGTYEVCLVVIFWDSCIAEYCAPITLTEGGGDCAGTLILADSDGFSMQFFATMEPEDDEVEYVWTFGDGETFTEYASSAGSDPWHTYTEEGEYVVCVVATNSAGCVTETCLDVVVGEPVGDCAAIIEVWDIEGLDVHFFGFVEPEDPEVEYVWTFGDGESFEDVWSSEGSDPWHEYAEPGEYIVCLEITTSTGCTDEVCIDLFVGDDSLDCSAFFEYESDGSFVSFFSSTVPGPGDVDSYSWSFGDGSSSDGANPEHEYAEPGEYEVCLTVIFADGCTATYCDVVVVEGESDCEAFIEIWSMDGFEVHFFGFVVPEFDEVAYTWYFGDGESFEEVWTSDGSDPSHVYTEAGWYNVCLVIETGSGCIDETCLEIYVGASDSLCMANFDYEIEDATVTFSNLSEGSSPAFTWTFGDGSFSYLENPVYTYSSTGEFEVCLTVFGIDSCVDTYCEVIEIPEAVDECEAYFEVASITPDADGWWVSFSNGSSGVYDGHAWSMGDGTISLLEEPAHYYTEPGTYLVCLGIGDSTAGCADVYCDELVLEVADGLEPESVTDLLTAYPNPVSDLLHIRFDYTEALRVDRITGIDGREFDVKAVQQGSEWLVDVNGLDNGLYLLHLSVKESRHYIPVLVKH
jgi:PKD repeat protein